jgi:hypothetical protein
MAGGSGGVDNSGRVINLTWDPYVIEPNPTIPAPSSTPASDRIGAARPHAAIGADFIPPLRLSWAKREGILVSFVTYQLGATLAFDRRRYQREDVLTSQSLMRPMDMTATSGSLLFLARFEPMVGKNNFEWPDSLGWLSFLGFSVMIGPRITHLQDNLAAKGAPSSQYYAALQTTIVANIVEGHWGGFGASLGWTLVDFELPMGSTNGWSDGKGLQQGLLQRFRTSANFGISGEY